MKDKTPLQAAINGNLDSFIARGTLKELKGKKTITIADIRAARNKVLGANG